MNTNAHSRRTVLGTIAGAIAGLAGCTGGPQQTGATDPFDDVRVEGESVVVTLDSNTAVEQVNLIDPDGSRVGSAEVVSGETRVEFELGTSYTPGTFSVTSESSGETSIEIRPELVIQEVGVGANHMERMPDSLGNTQAEEALIVVENKGNGPTSILNLIFRGDVPNPTEGVEESDSKSGIFDVKDDKGELEQVTLTGGGTSTLYSSTLPFSFAAEGENCESMPSSGRFEVVLGTSVGNRIYTQEYDVQYKLEESSGACSISIERPSE